VWQEINDKVPSDFKVTETVSKTLLKQEISEKLEAIGRLDPFLINTPEIVTEDNKNLITNMQDILVFSGYVPPGNHTLIIKY
jgi:hypothetical protein